MSRYLLLTETWRIVTAYQHVLTETWTIFTGCRHVENFCLSERGGCLLPADMWEYLLLTETLGYYCLPICGAYLLLTKRMRIFTACQGVEIFTAYRNVRIFTACQHVEISTAYRNLGDGNCLSICGDIYCLPKNGGYLLPANT